jgi:hypothetical protein
MRYLLIFTIVLALSCKRESIREPDLQTVLSTYNLRKVYKPLPILSGKIYEKVKNDLDLSNITTYEDENGKLTFIIGMTDQNKLYAFKGSDEFLYSGNMQDQNNGTIGILKNDGAITITFANGKRTIHELSTPEFNAQYAGFCQRAQNQSFKDCYNHEVDEFCDSFVSCVVIATQPQVSVLIAVACTCDA